MEVVRVALDPAEIAFQEILETLFVIRDPTTLNREGNHVGSQYRSMVFGHSNAQRVTEEAMIGELEIRQVCDDLVVTTVETSGVFWPAEEAPELGKSRKTFAGRRR